MRRGGASGGFAKRASRHAYSVPGYCCGTWRDIRAGNGFVVRVSDASLGDWGCPLRGPGASPDVEIEWC